MLCSGLTVYMAYEFNKNWSLVWMYAFLSAMVFEFLFVQSLLMFVVAILYKQQVRPL